MELSLRLIVIASVALIASSVIIFIFTSQSSEFDRVLTNQTDSAQCSIWWQKGDCKNIRDNSRCTRTVRQCIKANPEILSANSPQFTGSNSLSGSPGSYCDYLNSKDKCTDASICRWKSQNSQCKKS